MFPYVPLSTGGAGDDLPTGDPDGGKGGPGVTVYMGEPGSSRFSSQGPPCVHASLPPSVRVWFLWGKEWSLVKPRLLTDPSSKTSPQCRPSKVY